jgi:hypothetical protein
MQSEQAKRAGQQYILKTSCMQADLNFFIWSGAPAVHDVSDGEVT